MQSAVTLIFDFFRRHYHLRRQFVTWLISLVGFFSLIWLYLVTKPTTTNFFIYSSILYGLDSIIFLIVLSDRPKMRLVMLTAIFLLEVASAGYYLLILARPT